VLIGVADRGSGRGLSRLGERLRDPAILVQLGLATAIGVGSLWGLPGTDSWAADSISPRSCGLGAIVETYWPGHFHHYAPLHMALLSVLSLPWIGLAVVRAGTGLDALGAEIVKPFYMTGVEVSARLVAAIMAIALARATMTLWRRLAGDRAGAIAGAVVATNAVFVFYAHTGNLDVPYLFWLALALVELDRVASGEPREKRVLLLAAAAVLTKDQAFAALVLPLPVYLVLVPWLARRASVLRRDLLGGVLLSTATYALVSGAIPNPRGFRLRIAHLLGPASQDWMEYPRGLAGTLALAGHAARMTSEFSSWPIAIAASAGVAIAFTRRPWLMRARLLMPLVAAASFALCFSFPARQNEHRCFLPESIFLLPYSAIAFEWSWRNWATARPLVASIAALSLLPAVIGVASMDATLLVDPRYAAERFLAHLPAGTRVEVYGGPIFLPRVPSHLVAARPGVEPIADRQAIAGVTDLVDPAMDPRPRAPEAIVLGTELSDDGATRPSRWAVPPAPMQYTDTQSHAFLRALSDGSLGYERALRTACVLPWPLRCRRIHHSTGGEVWIYVRNPRVMAQSTRDAASPGESRVACRGGGNQ
jgi:hypothetical protein